MLESHEIFDFVEAELVPQYEIFDFVVEETCFLSRTRQATGDPVSIGVWVQVPFPAPV